MERTDVAASGFSRANGVFLMVVSALTPRLDLVDAQIETCLAELEVTAMEGPISSPETLLQAVRNEVLPALSQVLDAPEWYGIDLRAERIEIDLGVWPDDPVWSDVRYVLATKLRHVLMDYLRLNANTTGLNVETPAGSQQENQQIPALSSKVSRPLGTQDGDFPGLRDDEMRRNPKDFEATLQDQVDPDVQTAWSRRRQFEEAQGQPTETSPHDVDGSNPLTFSDGLKDARQRAALEAFSAWVEMQEVSMSDALVRAHLISQPEQLEILLLWLKAPQDERDATIDISQDVAQLVQSVLEQLMPSAASQQASSSQLMKSSETGELFQEVTDFHPTQNTRKLRDNSKVDEGITKSEQSRRDIQGNNTSEAAPNLKDKAFDRPSDENASEQVANVTENKRLDGHVQDAFATEDFEQNDLIHVPTDKASEDAAALQRKLNSAALQPILARISDSLTQNGHRREEAEAKAVSLLTWLIEDGHLLGTLWGERGDKQVSAILLTKVGDINTHVSLFKTTNNPNLESVSGEHLIDDALKTDSSTGEHDLQSARRKGRLADSKTDEEDARGSESHRTENTPRQSIHEGHGAETTQAFDAPLAEASEIGAIGSSQDVERNLSDSHTNAHPSVNSQEGPEKPYGEDHEISEQPLTGNERNGSDASRQNVIGHLDSSETLPVATSAVEMNTESQRSTAPDQAARFGETVNTGGPKTKDDQPANDTSEQSLDERYPNVEGEDNASVLRKNDVFSELPEAVVQYLKALARDLDPSVAASLSSDVARIFTAAPKKTFLVARQQDLLADLIQFLAHPSVSAGAFCVGLKPDQLRTLASIHPGSMIQILQKLDSDGALQIAFQLCPPNSMPLRNKIQSLAHSPDGSKDKLSHVVLALLQERPIDFEALNEIADASETRGMPTGAMAKTGPNDLAEKPSVPGAGETALEIVLSLSGLTEADVGRIVGREMPGVHARPSRPDPFLHAHLANLLTEDKYSFSDTYKRMLKLIWRLWPREPLNRPAQDADPFKFARAQLASIVVPAKNLSDQIKAAVDGLEQNEEKRVIGLRTVAARLSMPIEKGTMGTQRSLTTIVENILQSYAERKPTSGQASEKSLIHNANQGPGRRETPSNASHSELLGSQHFDTETTRFTGPEPSQETLLVSETAGLVLLHPFYNLLFERMDISRDGKAIAADHIPRALGALLFLGGATEAQDPMNRVLLGGEAGRQLPEPEHPDQATKDLMDGLLRSVVARWGRLGSTSPDGLRDTFLRRTGSLRFDENGARLRVAPGPFDMLLDGLPWSISPVTLPWMPLPCYVSWREDNDA
ncbi:MAG: contractile injection system tape measure protein [Roseobacter sp.]